MMKCLNTELTKYIQNITPNASEVYSKAMQTTKCSVGHLGDTWFCLSKNCILFKNINHKNEEADVC